MTRALMSSALPADRAEVLSDNEQPYSMEEEAFIAHRTQELLSERLNDRDRFRDLMSGIDAEEIEPHLFRALMNLNNAIKGEAIGEVAMTIALSAIWRRLRIEARIVWTEECRAEAEKQMKGEFA